MKTVACNSVGGSSPLPAASYKGDSSKMECSPQNGGCWYCSTDDPPLTFCFEFDTFIHIDCINVQIEKGQYDPELEIIRREFAI